MTIITHMHYNTKSKYNCPHLYSLYFNISPATSTSTRTTTRHFQSILPLLIMLRLGLQFIFIAGSPPWFDGSQRQSLRMWLISLSVLGKSEYLRSGLETALLLLLLGFKAQVHFLQGLAGKF